MQSKSTKPWATPARLANLKNIQDKARTKSQSKAKYLWIAETIKTHNSDDCLIWPFAKGGNGYGHCKFMGSFVDSHRVAFFLSNGRWPVKETRHTCDNKLCFNPRHLIEGSRLDNMRDAVERNRMERGEDRPLAKLTEDDVRNLRKDRASLTYRKLACKYGICTVTAERIVKRKIWKHVI